jgi:hypothetical protein
LSGGLKAWLALSGKKYYAAGARAAFASFGGVYGDRLFAFWLERGGRI